MTTTQSEETRTCAVCKVTGPAWTYSGNCGISNYATVANAESGPFAKRGLRNGDKLCVPCADECERERIADVTVRRCSGYLSDDGRRVVTWTGGKLGTVTHTGKEVPRTRRSADGARHYIRVRDCHGGLWYGTGARGMWTNLRRAKGGA